MSDIEGSEPDWRLAARVAVTRCGQMTQFQIGKGLQLLSCSLDSWLQDKLQNTTTVQRRRFVAVPRHAGKDYWQVGDTQKSLLRQPFFKNRGIKIRLPGCT